MLTDENALTLQLKPQTEGYSDYFSQLGTHLSCSFLDKLPNPERKKTYIYPGQEQFCKIKGRCFLTVKTKGMRSQDYHKETTQNITWNYRDDTTFSLNVNCCTQIDF